MPALPERRSGTVKIGERMFRVREPAPRRALMVIAQVTTLLGPMLTKIISGQLVVYEPAVCPVCRAEGQATRANGRWSCLAEVAEGQRCPGNWDAVPITGEDGEPEQVGLAYVLGDRDLRAAMALVIEQRIGAMDPKSVLELAERALPGAADLQHGGGWIELRTPDSLDHYLPSGMAIVHLLRAAMEAWILPSLVDDWTDTALDSSTSQTKRDGGPPTTNGGLDVPPASAPSGTRAPPPVRRHG